MKFFLSLLVLCSGLGAFAQCSKYEPLLAGEWDDFLVGGHITRLRDHRFAKSNDKLDPLIVYVGFEKLQIAGLIEPLACKEIAVVKGNLTITEVNEYYQTLVTAMNPGLSFRGKIKLPFTGKRFTMSTLSSSRRLPR